LASARQFSTSQAIAIWTWTKAVASCMTAPRVSSPARYLGVVKSKGTTGTSTALPLTIQVSRPDCQTTARQRATSSARRRCAARR